LLRSKDVAKSAEAMAPTTIPTQPTPPEATPPPAPPEPPAAPVKPPTAAAKGAEGEDPTPKAARPSAKKHVAAKKAKGKKAHK
jgi:hypothetical protein